MAAVKFEDQFLCSICLDLFTEPVYTPCGHNFCKQCLSEHWDTSAPCRCPLCKELFHIKPELKVNTLLSELLSQFKQETGSSCEHESSAGEVSCDYCTDPKLKALKSCLVCLSSYCETHLQPHLNVPKLRSHQLIQPVDNMEERMCPQHHRPLELFCCNDHLCVCTMCSVLEHQSHKFVTLKEEFERRKASLQQTQEQSLHMVEQRRVKIQELQSSVQLSERAANTEMATGLQVFSALIECVERSREAFIQELQERQRQTQKQAEALILELQQEICALQQRSTEAETLQRSEDHLHFLLHSTALTPPTGLKDWSRVTLDTETYEGTAARALTELEEKLTAEIHKVFKDKLGRVRQFAVDLTLDTDTANVNLSVSKDLKQVHHTDQKNFRDSPQRFSWKNVLTKQRFSLGKFYFEVQVKGKTSWTVGVAKESVQRKKNTKQTLTSEYGYWCLYLKNIDEYEACSDPPVPLTLKCPPQKVGVFVDCDEGLVSFYDADSADLIYSFTGCSFNEKLFPFLNPCNNFDGINSAPLILTAVKKY
ncbi:E3 ubiquitin-protein ligase TRIM21-like [Boleophthalmus pectinirostris]|uniref:E3 ubiquitin-protein ligase TRIM21-like n=1 Tax=Boleophthalmus pectinirostris TaxID=150288 RepID=UPI0024301023|nr:E3 ubiquitin-protein ligase TRIM21-like [Boleophthalmus pectinirostris]